MFSKSRINETSAKSGEAEKPKVTETALSKPVADYAPMPPKGKAGTSILSTDLTVVGDLKTTGDIQIEGLIEGDIRAHMLIVAETATIRGEIVADDIVINGRVIGRVRGLKVRLTSTARVEGDIIHKTIAIESGAHFEGSVQRQDDPLAATRTALPAPTAGYDGNGASS